jgi:hypothetical protein
LFDVVGALGGFGAGFGFAQGGQEQAGQNCDNGYDDKEFDEGEGEQDVEALRR